MKQAKRRQTAIRVALCVSILAILVGYASAAGATARLVPDLYPTIQNAIDHAADGDSILLSPGTYRGPGNRNIEFNGLNLVLTSREGAERTIIDCEHAGRGFNLDWFGAHGVIEKVTITNGVALGQAGAGSGGGIKAVAAITIRECRILGNHAREGGGLYLGAYSGSVTDCVISGNRAESGGGGVLIQFTGPVTISDCVITGNSSGSGGGGIGMVDGYRTLRGCTIAGNCSDSHGGGVYSSDRLNLDRCIVWGNWAPHEGPEMWIFSPQTNIGCSDIDSTGIYQEGPMSYDGHCIFTDPFFCDPFVCQQTAEGDWRVDAVSLCLPEHSPCGDLIGALGQGCAIVPEGRGACCLEGGVCAVETADQCGSGQGTYLGDDTVCDPNPCYTSDVQFFESRVRTWGQIKTRYRADTN